MRYNQPRGGVAENRHSLAPCTWYRASGVVGPPVIVGCVAAITDTPLARALHTERGLLSAVHMGLPIKNSGFWSTMFFMHFDHCSGLSKSQGFPFSSSTSMS